MDIESLDGLSAEVQVQILLSALETITVDMQQVKAIYLETRSDRAHRFLEEHEQTAARIKERIIVLFTKK